LGVHPLTRELRCVEKPIQEIYVLYLKQLELIFKKPPYLEHDREPLSLVDYLIIYLENSLSH